MQILVVEDTPSFRRALVEFLRSLRHEVEEAEDGLAAWQALAARRFDTVISDNKMPLMTGLELLRRLRQSESHPQVKFILMSSEITPEVSRECGELGARVVSKPFRFKNLIRLFPELGPFG